MLGIRAVVTGMDRLQRVAVGSLAVSLVVLGVKYAAYVLTGSVALYSDALESTVNVATAAAAILAIRVAARPPDKGHPYGHHKAEYLSAVVVGALIIVAAVLILREAYLGFLAPKPLDAPWAGLAVSAAATALNAAWSAVLIRQGRLQRSAALAADGKHLLADVVTSVGVLVGVALVVLTRIEVLDAAINEQIAYDPTSERDFVVWAQGFMSGLVIRAPPGIDEELDLLPSTYPLARQTEFLRAFCRDHPDRDYTDGVLDLYRLLRRPPT